MDTIPYRGVTVARFLTTLPAPCQPVTLVYRWRCGRCKRLGPEQSREKAEAGKVRHEEYHRAQDKAAAKQREVAP